MTFPIITRNVESPCGYVKEFVANSYMNKLGTGAFADVYKSASNPAEAIKVTNEWDKGYLGYIRLLNEAPVANSYAPRINWVTKLEPLLPLVYDTAKFERASGKYFDPDEVTVPCYIIGMELLEQIESDWPRERKLEHLRFTEIISGLSDSGDWKNSYFRDVYAFGERFLFAEFAPVTDIDKQLEDFAALLRKAKVESGRGCFDIHYHNVMRRQDGSFVVTDPIGF